MSITDNAESAQSSPTDGGDRSGLAAPLAWASPLGRSHRAADSRGHTASQSSLTQLGASGPTSGSLPDTPGRSTASRRAEVSQQLRDAFRERQRQSKARQVEHLTLGKGLGALAEETLVEGYYNPQKILEPLSEEAKELLESIDLRQVHVASTSSDAHTPDSGEEQQGPSSRLKEEQHPLAGEDEEHAEAEEQPFLEKFRCTYSPVKSVLQARAEIESNMETAQREFDSACCPLLFEDMLASLTISLEALEEGSATARVSLPVRGREQPSRDPGSVAAQCAEEERHPEMLVGAVDVMNCVREHLMATAYTLVPLLHTAQWVAQYSIAFLRSLTASTEEEAQIRLELLARCVRLVGKTERFCAVLLLLEAKMEEYDAFDVLQESAESHVGGLLEDVEAMLDEVLKVPFPARRARLREVEKGVKQKLQRALLFLNEIDYYWTPNVRLHAEWKVSFLSGAFHRIHCVIAPRHAKCLMGFVDDAVYRLVSDTRVSGKLLGASPVQPQVPMARQVEYERVMEGLTLQQIGMQVKAKPSIIVGAQVCMSSRYALRQSTRDFNSQWGFDMDEAPPEVTSNNEVEKLLAKIKSKVRGSMPSNPSGKPAEAVAGPRVPPPAITGGAAASQGRPPRHPAGSIFLTQGESD